MHLNKLFFITSVLCFCSCDQLKDTPLPADDLNKTSGAAAEEEPKELEKPNQTKDLIKDDEPANTSDIIATSSLASATKRTRTQANSTGV